MIEELSDKELMLMVRNGNEQAFDAIYRRYHRTMYVYSLRLLKDRDIAADIVQGVFIKLWEHSEMLPQDVNVRSYLYSMVRNRVVNYIRDNRTRLIHNYMIVRENGLVEDADFLQQIEEQSRQKELRKAIEALPPQQKKVIKFRFAGMTNKEIAQEENLSLNTVNVHYRLGMKKLKDILKVTPLLMTLFLC